MLMLYLRVFIHMHILHKEELLLPSFTLWGWEGEREKLAQASLDTRLNKTRKLQTFNNSLVLHSSWKTRISFFFLNRCVKINPHKSMRVFDKRINAAGMLLDLWETPLCWLEMHLNGFLLFLLPSSLELLRLEKLSRMSVQPCLGFDGSARTHCGHFRDIPGVTPALVPSPPCTPGVFAQSRSRINPSSETLAGQNFPHLVLIPRMLQKDELLPFCL